MVKLKSRIPEIQAAIPLRVAEAIHHGTENIASDASERAKEQYSGDDPFEIHAGEQDGGYGVLANWYYFFGEFGTHHQPSRPFMIPAAEAGKDDLVVGVETALRDL